jgi:glycosyl hydrolase family 2
LRFTQSISLNGTWQMQPESKGLDEPKTDRWCDVTLPRAWTAFLSPSSGVPSEMVPNRMGWFRRSFTAPQVPAQSRLVLRFGAVNFYAVVFINGKRCGEHAGDALPFNIDITDFVRSGEPATVLVGVQDISLAEARRTGSAMRGAEKKLLYPGLSSHPGIWGDISLEVLPELHIVGVRVRTTVPEPGKALVGSDHGRIHVTVSIKNETGRTLGFSLTCEVYDGARQAIAFAPVRAVVNPGELSEIDLGTSWESAALWWPDEPHLYSLRTALWGTQADATGEIIDRVHSTIGFREFRIDGDQFVLNGVPTALRSESLSATAPRLLSETRLSEAPGPVDLDDAINVLRSLKRKLGINAVRFHRLPPNPVLLDAADQVGLMAIVEFPLPDDERRYAIRDPRFWVNTEELARKWVRENAHHPSIVMWSIDQGMVQRYGLAAIPGLQSLARAVADVDLSRPVENSGDGDAVNAAELGVSTPVSLFFPHTGVACRSAAPYEPESIDGRALPALPQPAQPWAGERPADQPLCILEHTRRTASPNDLAFFLGDTAYAPGLTLAEAAAPLIALELGACRISRMAAVNTIGRAPAPPAAPTAHDEVIALPTELFGNFYAGTRFVENLVVRNDTRFDQDIEMVCEFNTADEDVAEHHEEVYVPAGCAEKKPIAFELPDIRQVQDADRATSMLAEFSVQLTGTRSGTFANRRKVAIWPHVRSTGARRIGLYDPDGRTAAALSAVGAKYSAAHGAPHGEFDTIIVGEGALDQGSTPDREAIREFVAQGGVAVVLAQRAVPYDLSPVTLILEADRAASITFVRDAEHSVLKGLSSFEMRWWQGDHRVARGCFRKPARGNFRCLVDAGGPGGLGWAAAVEVFHGKGSFVFSQMSLVDKAARSPIAGLLLARLADAEPTWEPLETRALPGELLFGKIGAQAPELDESFGSGDLDGVRVVLATGESLSALSDDQRRALRAFAQDGGCLFLHNMKPNHERLLTKLVDHDLHVTPAKHDRLVFERPGQGLARGLSSADLYFADHGSSAQGNTLRRVYAATAVVKAHGDLTGAACTLDSPTDYALLTFNTGKGRVIVDQLRWHIRTQKDARSARMASALMTNLGVAVTPPDVLRPSVECNLIDISATCNATLTDAIPGDEEGWTNRGPDSDLRAFSPGLLASSGLPFHVSAALKNAGRNCIVLGPRDAQAAAPIPVGHAVAELGLLVACQGHVRRGEAVGHLTVLYADGLETQIPLRYEVHVLDWNERPRQLDGAEVAWKGRTAIGEPAAIYSRVWQSNRPDDVVESVTFSSTRSGATPILLALTAVPHSP